MAAKIQWETDLDKALARARKEDKIVLLDFFNPGWIGCQQMEAVTFPTPRIVDFINAKIIPLRLPFDHPTLAKEFRIKWTPTLIILDASREEHHRATGFLAPNELIPALLLGMAKASFNIDQFPPALVLLDTLLASHAESAAAPEAIYLQGVCRYKTTKTPQPLKAAYEKLAADYPNSEWTQRAAPYRLL